MTLPAALLALALAFGGGPVPAIVDGTTPDSARLLAYTHLDDYGWDDDEFACLDLLWWEESKWKYQADNPRSSAYGIPQALTELHGLDEEWQASPTLQIRWGLDYIRDRYGTPCEAWVVWQERCRTDHRGCWY